MVEYALRESRGTFVLMRENLPNPEDGVETWIDVATFFDWEEAEAVLRAIRGEDDDDDDWDPFGPIITPPMTPKGPWPFEPSTHYDPYRPVEIWSGNVTSTIINPPEEDSDAADV